MNDSESNECIQVTSTTHDIQDVFCNTVLLLGIVLIKPGPLLRIYSTTNVSHLGAGIKDFW